LGCVIRSRKERFPLKRGRKEKGGGEVHTGGEITRLAQKGTIKNGSILGGGEQGPKPGSKISQADEIKVEEVRR